jgi:hypothetical protein
MHRLIELLAGVTRNQVQRLQPGERAALVRECQRVLALAQSDAVDVPAQRMERVEVEDWPDA